MKKQLGILVMGFLLTSCGLMKNGSDGEDENNAEQSSNNGDSVSSEMFAHINAGLKDGGLSAVQADGLTQEAAAKQQGLSLLAPDGVQDIAPAVMSAAVDAIDSEEAGLADADLKAKAARIIAEKGYESIKDLSEGMDKEAKKELSGDMASALFSAMDEGGFEGEELQKAMSDVAEAVISKLDDAGNDKESMEETVAHVCNKMIGSMDEGGMKADEITSSVDEVMEKMIAAQEDAGISKDASADLSAEIVRSAVAAMKDAGIPDDKMDAAIESSIRGSVRGMSRSHVDKEKYEDVVAKMAEKAMDGMQDAGFSKEDMIEKADAIIMGSISEMEKLDFDSAEKLQNAVAKVSSHAIKHYKNVGVDSAADLEKVSARVGKSTSEAMAEIAEKSDKFDDADIAAAMEEVARENLATVYEEYYKDESFKAEKDFDEVADQFTNGLKDGLEEMGWDANEIQGIEDELGDGYKEFVETHVDDKDATDFGVETPEEKYPEEYMNNDGSATGANSDGSASGTSEEEAIAMEKDHCMVQGGSWDDSSNACQYPEN